MSEHLKSEQKEFFQRRVFLWLMAISLLVLSATGAAAHENTAGPDQEPQKTVFLPSSGVGVFSTRETQLRQNLGRQSSQAYVVTIPAATDLLAQEQSEDGQSVLVMYRSFLGWIPSVDLQAVDGNIENLAVNESGLQEYTVNGQVGMYTLPDIHSSKVGNLFHGEKLTAIRMFGNNWILVSIENQLGWVPLSGDGKGPLFQGKLQAAATPVSDMSLPYIENRYLADPHAGNLAIAGSSGCTFFVPVGDNLIFDLREMPPGLPNFQNLANLNTWVDSYIYPHIQSRAEGPIFVIFRTQNEAQHVFTNYSMDEGAAGSAKLGGCTFHSDKEGNQSDPSIHTIVITIDQGSSRAQIIAVLAHELSHWYHANHGEDGGPNANWLYDPTDSQLNIIDAGASFQCDNNLLLPANRQDCEQVASILSHDHNN